MEYCDVRPSIRPLHFVATFAKGESLGLVLSEAIQIDDADKEEEKGEEWDVASKTKWQQATSDALPGEVFVKGIVSGGQAEEMNVFEIGDRLQGVGELVVGQGGFETVVAMLQDQPKASKYVTLHFDRKSALIDRPSESIESSGPVQSIDAGAWSVTGRRAAQEDAFVLSEVYDEAGKRSVRLAGIMDGHLGAAASNFVRDAIAETLSEEMMKASADAPMDELLQQSWNRICINYRQSCEDDASCSAEFDPLEGVLQAFTGGENAVAGTTAVIMALDMQSSIVSVLNCGDSRGIIVDKTGKVRFVTNDHSPGTETEMERFEKGISEGLLYELPECILSKWIVPVGDYNYAVSRSLEGSFATSRGVISTPDISRVPIDAGMTLILASDGLWEVIDSQQVSSILYKLRYDQKETASDAAKILTSLALEKGSADNVSVVVMYVQ
jgi:serine/threonine protein phosphatase PrpC